MRMEAIFTLYTLVPDASFTTVVIWKHGSTFNVGMAQVQMAACT